MRETLGRFGGMMARFNVDDKGTIMFAAFGPPPAQHEDDAPRATLCSLEVVRVLAEAGHAVRCGVTTGQVFAGSVGNASRGEYTFYGTTVNMAARLMVHESNEDVLCCQATMHDAKGEVEMGPELRLVVKGRPAPMPAYRPLRKKASAANPMRQAVGSNTRRAERERLRERMEALHARGEGGLVVLEGEAGMGKSWMLGAMEKEAIAKGVRVLKGSCSALEASTPLYAWGCVMQLLWRPPGHLIILHDRPP